MNPDQYEQLEAGYEEALDATTELADLLSELQDTVIDSLSDLHGDLRTMICTLRACANALHLIAGSVQ